MKPIAVNRKARHDYFILETYEAGIGLHGNEVKSIREGNISLKESFVRLVSGEAFLVNCHIQPYSKIQGHTEVDPTRSRKLLLSRRELDRLKGQCAEKGHTIVPLKLYFNKRGYAKVEIAVAKGKKQHDKRETLKRKIHDREAAQAIKSFSHKGR